MKKIIKEILRKSIIVCSLVLAVAVAFTFINDRPTFADSGFSTSHSSGGSSHSSSHSSSSSRRSSSSSSSRSRSSGGSSNMSPQETIICLVILIGIIMFSLLGKSNNKNKAPVQPRIDETAVENKIKQYIPDFNKKEFLDNCYKMYCDIQVAWMDFKLEDVKDILTDELYSMYESQLATLEVKGEQNIMKDFVLRNSYLKNVIEQNNTITITTGFVIEFYDYIADRETGKTIRGESRRKMRVTYEMKFRQTLDASKKVDKCPNCGAPVDVNSSGVCGYCRTKLVTENVKWVLTEKQALGQYYI